MNSNVQIKVLQIRLKMAPISMLKMAVLMIAAAK